MEDNKIHTFDQLTTTWKKSKVKPNSCKYLFLHCMHYLETDTLKLYFSDTTVSNAEFTKCIKATKQIFKIHFGI